MRARLSVLRRPLARAAAGSVLINGGGLVLSLMTGIMVARVLDTDGRGELSAIVTIATTLGWLASSGGRQAISYRLSVDPGSGPRLLGTWLVLLVVLGAGGTLLAELLLPALLSAQTDETLRFGQIYLLSLTSVIGAELLAGVAFGRQAFFLANTLRILPQATTVVLYVAFLLADEFTLETALISNAVAYTMPLAVGLVWALRRVGAARPSRRLARETLSYGLRGHLSQLGMLVNSRLDLMIMPAFLAASSVGLYAIATTISAIFMALADALSGLVLAAAARKGGLEGKRTVVTAVKGVLVLGGAVALVLGLIAPQLIAFVYGESFRPAAEPLRILLPGSVLFAAAFVLIAGIFSANRPFTAATSQIVGTIVTAIGLALFLESGGTNAAALVSSVSYAVVFAIALVAFLVVARNGLAPAPEGERAAAVEGLTADVVAAQEARTA